MCRFFLMLRCTSTPVFCCSVCAACCKILRKVGGMSTEHSRQLCTAPMGAFDIFQPTFEINMGRPFALFAFYLERAAVFELA